MNAVHGDSGGCKWQQHRHQQKNSSTGVQNQFLRFYFRSTETMVFIKQNKANELNGTHYNKRSNNVNRLIFLLHFNRANALHWNAILCMPLNEWERACASLSGKFACNLKNNSSQPHVHTPIKRIHICVCMQ